MKRRIVGVLINTIGILAGLGGIVSAVMTLSPIVDIVRLARLGHNHPARVALRWGSSE